MMEFTRAGEPACEQHRRSSLACDLYLSAQRKGCTRTEAMDVQVLLLPFHRVSATHSCQWNRTARRKSALLVGAPGGTHEYRCTATVSAGRPQEGEVHFAPGLGGSCLLRRVLPACLRVGVRTPVDFCCEIRDCGNRCLFVRCRALMYSSGFLALAHALSRDLLLRHSSRGCSTYLIYQNAAAAAAEGCHGGSCRSGDVTFEDIEEVLDPLLRRRSTSAAETWLASLMCPPFAMASLRTEAIESASALPSNFSSSDFSLVPVLRREAEPEDEAIRADAAHIFE